MQILRQILELVEGRIGDYARPRRPAGLYEPVGYIMTLGGKRIRPLLCAAGFLLDRQELEPRVLEACLALEVFHNFSLVHDDIMDDAPLRRGRATVHERWDTPTAILAGDVMLIDVFDLLRRSCQPGQLEEVLRCFHRVAAGVCEGQQMDMDFERSRAVAWEAYLEMIRGKTALLLGGSLELGGLLSGMDPGRAATLGRIGEYLGIAFQLEDDWLDAFGDPALIGKRPGGDILQGKKTALWIQCEILAGETDRRALLQWFSGSPPDQDPEARVREVKRLFECSGAAAQVARESERYHREALALLQGLNGQGPGAGLIRHLAAQLQGRRS